MDLLEYLASQQMPGLSSPQEGRQVNEGNGGVSRPVPGGRPRGEQISAGNQFSELSQLHVETQKYWILAVNAALAEQNRKLARGAREK